MTKVFLSYIATSPGQVVSHLKEALWFPNTCCLMAHLQDVCKASDGGLVHRGSISARLDLEIGQDVKETEGEKDDGRIADEQAVRHLFGS